ncbi:LPXTG cell wall anchor domain-containing protein [Egicoccus sp. AB-alg6-2]|uniref:LPXTG cell wall anchor domain-containing protein n=1 Tax=Egicoccus sp. AB-alg6-2 TaxID=3242692 RepID=UPI00359E23BF
MTTRLLVLSAMALAMTTLAAPALALDGADQSPSATETSEDTHRTTVLLDSEDVDAVEEPSAEAPSADGTPASATPGSAAPGSAKSADTTPRNATSPETSTDSACATLAIVRPDGITGDAQAVTITAQTLDAELAGWSFVQWTLDPLVRADMLVVVGRDGSRTEVPATAGHAEAVLELVVCGHREGPAVPVDPDGPVEGEAPVDETPDPDGGEGDGSGGEGDDSGPTPDGTHGGSADEDTAGGNGHGEELPRTGSSTSTASLTMLGLASLLVGALLLRIGGPAWRPQTPAIEKSGSTSARGDRQ